VAQLQRDVIRGDRLPFVTVFKDFADPIPESQRQAVARTRDCKFIHIFTYMILPLFGVLMHTCSTGT
jgi:hypothetical protein